MAAAEMAASGSATFAFSVTRRTLSRRGLGALGGVHVVVDLGGEIVPAGGGRGHGWRGCRSGRATSRRSRRRRATGRGSRRLRCGGKRHHPHGFELGALGTGGAFYERSAGSPGGDRPTSGPRMGSNARPTRTVGSSSSRRRHPRSSTSTRRSAASGDPATSGEAPVYRRAMTPDQIALQLYTVRGLAAEDLAGTLRAVAAAGYRAVELASLPPTAPGELPASRRRPSDRPHESIDLLRADAGSRGPPRRYSAARSRRPMDAARRPEQAGTSPLRRRPTGSRPRSRNAASPGLSQPQFN
jgi:hypothetical protein